MALALLPCIALAAEPATTGSWGSGENSGTWSYVEASKTLTIEGNGTVTLCDSSNQSVIP